MTRLYEKIKVVGEDTNRGIFYTFIPSSRKGKVILAFVFNINKV